MPKVQRHKDIYSALSDVMNKIHALSIQAFTLDEYEKNPVILESPDCSKK
jgi:stress-induced morphogen